MSWKASNRLISLFHLLLSLSLSFFLITDMYSLFTLLLSLCLGSTFHGKWKPLPFQSFNFLLNGNKAAFKSHVLTFSSKTEGTYFPTPYVSWGPEKESLSSLASLYHFSVIPQNFLLTYNQLPCISFFVLWIRWHPAHALNCSKASHHCYSFLQGWWEVSYNSILHVFCM